MIDIETFIKDIKQSTRQDFKDFEEWHKLCFDESSEVSKEAWDKLK
jgi:hypothetical protein